MTTPKTEITALSRLRRTIARFRRRVIFTSATLTLAVPPFFKLEIKTEAAKPKTRCARHDRAA